MKTKNTIIRSLTLLVFIIFTLNSCGTKAPVATDVSAEIIEANKGFLEAFNTGNAKAVASKYTSDAKLYPTNRDIIEGKEAIEAFWNEGINMGIKKAELNTISAKSYGSFAIEEGRYKLFAEGDQMIDQGKYIVTWKKENGQWKLYQDIFNTSNPIPPAPPAPPVRAALNDTVWVVWNHIKADKVEQFENYNFNILEPATSEYYPKMRNTVRFTRPVEANKDGTFTYFYIIDPATSPDGYDMMLPLTAKYGEEKAIEYLKMFKDCLVDGKQEWVITTQTKW
ncbi:MAG: DUF4440 domain-containing protein [Bacteroidota bacterium]